MTAARLSKKQHEQRARKRLITRIKKEFEKKFFIGDIAISDQEYDILIREAKQITAVLMRSGRAPAESVPLSVALVQIGIRKYDGKYFWPYVEGELGVERSLKRQQLMGETFINTLRKHRKYITDESERVQNILFHGFVSNYYSKGLFELLFQYYSKDLERDIYRNTTEQMQALMDTLEQKASQDEKQSESFTAQFMVKGSRAYKLKSHTLQAISAHPIHSRTRLRRLLRLIDNAFWKDAIPKNPTSRLTIMFKEWVNDSPAYKKEYKLCQLGEIRNRGKKHFSAPYLFANIGAGFFELKLPAQIVTEKYAKGLAWEISTNARTFCLDADTYPVLTGYKTEDAKAPLSHRELFGNIRCQLIYGDCVVRKFQLPKSTVRFFDMEGDYASRLFRIPMCAYTPAGSVLHSGALVSKIPHGNITRWDFEFQQGDLVVLPDGSGMVVGDAYIDGFVPRGQVADVEYHAENQSVLPVYAIAPELLLTIPKEKLAGTVLYCNDVRYRLSDCTYTEFENRDARGAQAILLPLKQFEFCKSDGEKTIILDTPGMHYDKRYSFLLVKGLSVEFPGSPYIFEERGAVLFPPHLRVTGNYEKLQGENGYQFALSEDETNLDIVINGTIPLQVHIPMLLWSSDKGNWRILPAGELWHTEFFEIHKLYLRSPIKKIRIFPDTDAPDDEDSEIRMLTAEHGKDGICTIDMTRFRSWLTRDIMKNDIILKLGSTEYTFATVYTKSLVVSYDVTANYEDGVLTWVCDIIGKAEYYLDIVHVGSGKVLADKEKLTDGKLILQNRLRSGIYRFTLYEAEEDDSGFDDLVYEQLLCNERQLTNLNDASGQFLSVRSFKSAKNSNLYTAFKRTYYVRDFEKLKKKLYTGRLYADGEDTGLNVTVEFLKDGDMRFFHVTAWHREEEINVDLLYDREQGTLELDQLPGLKSSESYLRYRELTYGEFIYFGILHDKLPEQKKQELETVMNISFPKSASYSGKLLLPIEQMGFSVRTSHALIRYGVRYAGDLQLVKPEQWLKIRNLDKKGLLEIHDAMIQLGLDMKLPGNRFVEGKTECDADLCVISNSQDIKEIQEHDNTAARVENTVPKRDPRRIPLMELEFTPESNHALKRKAVKNQRRFGEVNTF